MNEAGWRWTRRDSSLSEARPGPTRAPPARGVRAAMASMAPTHTPASAGGRRRPATPQHRGCEGLERDPGGSTVPTPTPTMRRNKGGGGARRRPDSAGRDPLGGRHRLLKGGQRGWRALLWLLLGQSTEPASRPRSPLRLRAGAGLPLAEAPRGAAFPPSMGLPRRTGDRAELRKSLKPLLEKRRRARINESLRQLKGLILPLLGRESSCYSKLEKADILEMTVRFLQELPASSCPAAAPAPSDSYCEGYRACLARLARVLPACRVLEPAVSARLLEHLRRRAAGASPNGRRAGDTCCPPSLSSPPPPAPLPPVPPRGPGLWRPW
uniref:Hes family bHLH transcription factor 2 n=2 Tax=Equus TaxID=9789 RepID=A0A9L0IHP3_EQUAS|nr:transcription factor HES-2 isoform X1 [Equus asinus]